MNRSTLPSMTSPVPLVCASEARLLRIPVHSRGWMRIRRGIYAERALYEHLPPWQRYEVRVHAYLRAYPDAILCAESAALILGLPLFREPRDLHVWDPESATSRRFGDVIIHTSQDLRTIEERDGIRHTSMLDTVTDLCRALPPAPALAVLDASLALSQENPITGTAVLELAEAQANRRGIEHVRWVTPRGTGLAESPSESISRAVIEWAGFEPPELQHEFRYEGSTDRTDFYFPTGAVIGEADGWQKYGLDDPDNASRRLADEKRREDRLRRHGHAFARWELRDAFRVDPLVRVLTAAGVRRVEPIQPLMLDSLRWSSRSYPRPR